MDGARPKRHVVPVSPPFLGALLALGICTVFLLLFEYQQAQEQTLVRVREEFTERLVTLESALTMGASQVEVLRVWAESHLSGCPERLDLDSILSRMTYRPDGDYSELEPAAGDAFSHANIACEGRPRSDDPLLARAVNLAVHLTAIQEALHKKAPALLRTYFVADTGLTCIYPYVPVATFISNSVPGGTFRDAAERFYVPHKGRHKNPQRKGYWTEVYLDRAGAGLMVTYAVPVYDRDSYVGLLGGDMGLGFLIEWTKPMRGPVGRILIVGNEDRVVADSAPQRREGREGLLLLSEAVASDVAEAIVNLRKRSATMAAVGDRYVFARRLSMAPWTFALVLDHKALASYLSLTRATSVVASVVLVCFLLVTYFAFRRSRAERARRRSEARFQAIFEHSAIGIVQADIKGSLLNWNSAFRQLVGFSDDELAHMTARDLTHPQDWEREKSMVREMVFSGQDKCQIEKRYVAKSGREIWVNLTLSRVPEPDGERDTMLGMVMDVSDHRALEEQLRQAQKMEAVGLLAGGIAHDFNNLLCPVLGYADILLKDSALAPAHRMHLAQIRSAAEKAAKLTQQLLAFGRKQALSLQPVNLNDILADFCRLMRPVIGEHIEVLVRTDPALRNVRADADQIQQVLINLALNARDAMARGGTLTFETGNVCLDEEYCRNHSDVKPGFYAMVSVSDTGCGMDAQTLDRIFEPFFTTKGVGRGTGLGLPVAFGIVKQHGGHIQASSVLGKGTRVEIYLPCIQDSLPAKREALSDRPPAAGRGEGRTVLVVEDEAVVRDLVNVLLTENGFRVLTAKDGESALALAASRGEKIDLLLTDVIMPGMNGKDLHRALAELRPELKVLYMSGYANSVVSDSDGVHFLQKPITAEDLIARVQSALDG